MDYGKLIRPEILDIEAYVPGKPIEEVQRELGLTDVIKLASNENPFGPSPQARQAIREAADMVSYYPETDCYLIKRALSRYLNLSPEYLFVGNGSDEVIKLFAETFYRPGDEVIVPEPTFSVYAYAARLMGARVVSVRGDDGYGNDLRRMAEAVTPRTKAIFICNPNNPTGTIVARKELAAFLDRIPPDVLVVVDQAYLDYVDDPDCAQGTDFIDSGRVLVLRTFSKIHGLAGLRLGYGIAHPELIACINRVKEPFSVNILAQRIGAVALEATDHVARSRENNAKGKLQIYGGLKKLGLPYLETQANFILFRVPTETRKIYDAMLRKGVIIRRADSFGLPGHFRVTIGTPEQNRRFLTALGEVMDELVGREETGAK